MEIPSIPARLLVVDDEEKMCNLLRDFFTQERYRVKTATTFEEASQLLKKVDFDLVVTDIFLVGASGTDVLRLAHNIDEDLPVIMITGTPNLDNATESLRFGAYDYLTKPLDFNRLRSVVRTALHQRELYQEKQRLEQENRFYQERLAALLRERTAQLRMTESQYQSLVESATDLIFTLDSQNRIVYSNPAALKVLDVQPKDLQGKSYLSLVATGFREKIRVALNSLHSGAATETYQEFRIEHRKGKTLWLGQNAILIRKGTEGITLQIIARDITKRVETEEELLDLRRQNMLLREEERRRVSRELHDSINQQLAVIKSYLDTTATNTDKDFGKLLHQSKDALDSTMNEVRRISHGLHPTLLDELGLLPTIEAYINEFTHRTGVTTKVNLPKNLPRLSSEVEIAAFRIMQEALTNIEKHAEASTIEITLSYNPDEIAVIIRDNGIGFYPKKGQRLSTTSSSMGLRNMAERARVLNGTLNIESRPDKGTAISAYIPLNESQGKLE